MPTNKQTFAHLENLERTLENALAEIRHFKHIFAMADVKLQLGKTKKPRVDTMDAARNRFKSIQRQVVQLR